MKPEMLGTALIEDLNRLACPEAQDRLASEPERAREALNALRFLDTTQLERFRREGWLEREELGQIERFAALVRERLPRVPDDADPVAFTHAHPEWQIVRERALELVTALDAFVDVDVPGWGRQHIPARRR